MRRLSKQFGANQILNDVSFDVAEGEFCILLGPSGCGKSTVLRLIAGLEQPTAGSIVIDGKPVDHLAPRDRDIAFVFQSYALYPHMTVFENLAFSLRLRRAAKTARMTAMTKIMPWVERPPAFSGSWELHWIR